MGSPDASFPMGSNRRKVIRASLDAVQQLKAKGNNFESSDSPLETWSAKGGIKFRESFKGILPEGEVSLKAYIEKVLESKKGRAIGVEFGGPGSTLFRGFSDKFFEKSFGVTLKDNSGSKEIYPPGHQLHFLNEINTKSTHAVVEGDILNNQTYVDLVERLGGRKIDLVIERMLAALDTKEGALVPIEPYMISKILQSWYELLDEGGLMLIQVPHEFNHLLKVWAEKINQEFGTSLEIKYKNGTDNIKDPSVFSLIKKNGAPAKLPMLDPRVVAHTPIDK